MHSLYSVSQVNAYIKNMFTQDFLLASISIKGEVSNCKYHSSGHIYFTLKDNTGTMACIMFAGNRSGLRFQLSEGQQVVVRGSIEVYERDGKYQLYAKEITLQGSGELYEKFIKLKTELEEMGMFSAEYKKTIPSNIKKLGIVTAPTGAAVQDIIQISKRRNPYLQIILFPAVVQGATAAQSIAKGIAVLDQAGVDVIIVGRGGGSIEDLWAFNEVIVAQAIFNCNTPVISAVGHETDTTIADFVADLRAATPSAAAELAVTQLEITIARMEQYKMILQKELGLRISQDRSRLQTLHLKLKHSSPQSRIREMRTYLITAREKTDEYMSGQIRQSRHLLELFAQRMNGLSPAARLARGYGFITDENENVITEIEDIKLDEVLKIQMLNGEIKARVIDKQTVRRNLSE